MVSMDGVELSRLDVNEGGSHSTTCNRLKRGGLCGIRILNAVPAAQVFILICAKLCGKCNFCIMLRFGIFCVHLRRHLV